MRKCMRRKFTPVFGDSDHIEYCKANEELEKLMCGRWTKKTTKRIIELERHIERLRIGMGI